MITNLELQQLHSLLCKLTDSIKVAGNADLIEKIMDMERKYSKHLLNITKEYNLDYVEFSVLAATINLIGCLEAASNLEEPTQH